MLELIFYKTAAGNEPVRDWLQGLSKGARKTVGSDLLTVQATWPTGAPLVDSFGKGLWEVRSTHNKVEYRLLFGIVGGAIYALHGFEKKTAATSNADKDLGYDRLTEVQTAERVRRAELAKKKSSKKKPSKKKST